MKELISIEDLIGEDAGGRDDIAMRRRAAAYVLAAAGKHTPDELRAIYKALVGTE